MPSRDFFIYSAEFLPLNANATATVRIPIQADAAFECFEITGDVRATTATEAVIAAPAVLVTITDEGTGRLIFDRAQLWTNLIGTAERPFFLPLPKTFKAAGVLSVSLSDLSTLTRTIRVALIGYKIFA